MNARTGHIFLSHGSDDRAEANALTDFLEGRGLTVWIAPRDVRPGVDYSEALQQAIEGCAAFLVLVTEKANRSPYVRVETEMAFSLEKPIFPVRNVDLQPGPGLALFLKIRHWTDAFGPRRDDSLERLARELRSIAGLAEVEVQKAAAVPVPPAPPAPPAPPPSVQTAQENRKAGGVPGFAIAGIVALILLALVGLYFISRGVSVPGPGPETNAVRPGGVENVMQQEQPAVPAQQPAANQSDQAGDEFYTPPEAQTEQPQQQDPPSEGFYDPPQ